MEKKQKHSTPPARTTTRNVRVCVIHWELALQTESLWKEMGGRISSHMGEKSRSRLQLCALSTGSSSTRILLSAPIRAPFRDYLPGEGSEVASSPKPQEVVVVPSTLPDEPKGVKIHQTHLPIPFPPHSRSKCQVNHLHLHGLHITIPPY